MCSLVLALVMISLSWRTIGAGAAAALVAAVLAVDVLVELPLVREDTVEGGVLGIILVAPAVATWLAVAGSPRQAIVILGPVAAAWVVLYLWSQHRPGVLAPPLHEWAIAAGLIGAAVVSVAVVAHRARAAPLDRATDRWRAAWLLLLVPALTCCVGCAKVVGDDLYEYQIPYELLDHNGTRADLGRLPVDLRLDEVDCANLGAHGNCDDVFVIRATDGASNPQVAARLVAHFNRRGWALQPDPYVNNGAVGYHRCRRVQGILTWHDLCLQFSSDNSNPPISDIPRPPDAVAVYLG